MVFSVVLIKLIQTNKNKNMSITSTFGLAGNGEGDLTCVFSKVSGRFPTLGKHLNSGARSMFGGGHKWTRDYAYGPEMPGMPLPSTVPNRSPYNPSNYYNANSGHDEIIYSVMRTQIDFQQQQLEFQRRQQSSNDGQAGVIKEMLTTFDNSFRTMMDLMSKMVTANVAASIEQTREPISFQSNHEDDNVIALNANQ